MNPLLLLSQLGARCREVAADLNRPVVIPPTVDDAKAYECGYRQGAMTCAIQDLERAAESYTSKRWMLELRDNLIDELWADGEFAEDWGPIVNVEALTAHLRVEWRKVLTQGLPEVLAYWLADYILFEAIDVAAVANVLAARTYERCCEDVDLDIGEVRDAA